MLMITANALTWRNGMDRWRMRTQQGRELPFQEIDRADNFYLELVLHLMDGGDLDDLMPPDLWPTP